MNLRYHVSSFGICCAAASVIALPGCGSSSSGLSKAQLAAKASAICATYTKAATAIPVPTDISTNPDSAAAFLDKLKPLAEAQKSSILALKPASDVKSLWDQFVAAGSRATALLEDADAKAHAKDRTGLNDLQQVATIHQVTIVPLARQLGATECAK